MGMGVGVGIAAGRNAAGRLLEKREKRFILWNANEGFWETVNSRKVMESVRPGLATARVVRAVLV